MKSLMLINRNYTFIGFNVGLTLCFVFGLMAGRGADVFHPVTWLWVSVASALLQLLIFVPVITMVGLHWWLCRKVHCQSGQKFWFLLLWTLLTVATVYVLGQ